ncbi:hypothetical protein BKA64DRAFT_687886 [Cadophora sp. MPI-SDFR-AT-0126]|nr:hypothetical protein BKA64DRAFT_687886 [Leotiomycetes sp. MPI-SDFR-AT-0126]
MKRRSWRYSLLLNSIVSQIFDPLTSRFLPAKNSPAHCHGFLSSKCEEINDYVSASPYYSHLHADLIPSNDSHAS